MQWDAPFTPAQVLYLLGFSNLKERGEYNCSCPFHNDKYKHFWVNMDKGTYKCQSACCGASGGVIKLYSEMTGLSTKESYKDILERLNLNTQADLKVIRKQVKEQLSVRSDIPMADIDKRDLAYNRMLNLLPLEERHINHLKDVRCLNDEFIKTRKYRSIPEKYHKEIAYSLIGQGIELKGIPGFHFHDILKQWEMKKAKPGILIPARDYNGKIQGFQIKLDTPLVIDGKTKMKYIWLSTKIKDGEPYSLGCSPTAFTHFACNYLQHDGKMIPHLKNGIVCITEGFLKADIFHFLTGHPIIAIPGVNCLEELKKNIQMLKDTKQLHTIYNMFDMDYETNESVAKQMNKLNEFCVSLGLNVIRPTWPAKFKGVDDYYISKIVKKGDA